MDFNGTWERTAAASKIVGFGHVRSRKIIKFAKVWRGKRENTAAVSIVEWGNLKCEEKYYIVVH